MFTSGVQSRSGLGAQLNGAPRPVTSALALVWLSALALGACDTAGHKVNPGGGGDGGDSAGAASLHGILQVPDTELLAPNAAGAVGIFRGSPGDGLPVDVPSQIRQVDFAGQSVWAASTPVGVRVVRVVPAPADSSGAARGVLFVATGLQDPATPRVIRLDSSGQTAWTWAGPKPIPDALTGAPLPIVATSAAPFTDPAAGAGADSGWVVVGTVGEGWNPQGAYVARVDPAGQTVWETTVGGAAYHEGALCVAVGPDGTVFLGGTSRYAPSAGAVYADGSSIPPGSTFDGGYLVALAASTGDVRWQTSFGNPMHPAEAPTGVTAVVPDAGAGGGVFAGGSTGASEMYVAHYDVQGQQDWLKTYQVPSGEPMSYLEAMAPAPDGGVMMAGWGHAETADPTNGPPWIHVAQVGRVDAAGKLVFLKTYAYLSYGGAGVDGDMHAYRIVPQGDGFLVSGDFLARGAATDGGAGEVSGAFLMLMDGAGKVL